MTVLASKKFMIFQNILNNSHSPLTHMNTHIDKHIPFYIFYSSKSNVFVKIQLCLPGNVTGLTNHLLLLNIHITFNIKNNATYSKFSFEGTLNVA